jgi:hypothetical protein
MTARTDLAHHVLINEPPAPSSDVLPTGNQREARPEPAP